MEPLGVSTPPEAPLGRGSAERCWRHREKLDSALG